MAGGTPGAGVLRALGGFERAFWLVDQTHSVNFVIIAHVGGRLEPGVLEQALLKARERHPLLATRIVEATPKEAVFSTDGVPPMALRVVERRSDGQWREEAEHELNTPLPWARGPLVRAVLVRGAERGELLLTFHHSAGDGRSGMNLLRDVLSFSDALARGEPVTPGLEAPPPSVETLFAPQVRGLGAFGRTLKFVGSVVLALGKRPRQLPVKDGEAKSRNGLLHAVLSAEEGERLRASCRKQGATVHGALCAALLKSVAAELDALEGKAKPRHLGCYSPVDLRDSFKAASPGCVGYFLGMGLTFHRVDGAGSPLPVAREVGGRLRELKDSGDIFIATAFQSRQQLGWDVETAARSSPPVAAAVSNLKEVDLPGRFGALTLDGAHFALSSSAWGPAPVLTVATHQGRLHLDLTYNVPRVQDEQARRVFERMVGELRALGAS
jgi:hypothetical protein